MIRDEILSMKPGRELDRLIGEHIFGYKNILNVADYWFIDDLNTWLPYYSTDIAAAWEVVGKLQNDYVLDFKLERKYCVATMKFIAVFEDLDGKKWGAHGWIAPEAICKAALLAVMEG